MTKKVRRRRRRRKRQAKKYFKMQPKKKTSNIVLNAKETKARNALVARLPGGAFREFLVQNVPGYSSLEGEFL